MLLKMYQDFKTATETRRWVQGGELSPESKSRHNGLFFFVFCFSSNNPESFLTKRSIEIVGIIKRFQQILKVKIPTSENVKKCLKYFVCKFTPITETFLKLLSGLLKTIYTTISNYELDQNMWSKLPTILK